MLRRSVLDRIAAGNAAMLARFGITPTHPRTGMAAVGVIRGRPVWPVAGGSEPAPEKPAEPAPQPTEPKPEPVEPVKDETDWKAESRKWEARAKENKSAADRLAEIEAANQTELEKAQKKSEADAARATAATLRAVRSEVKSMADKFIDREDAVLRLGDLTRFVTDDEIDEKAIADALDEVLKTAPHLERKTEDPAPEPPKPSARPTERLKPGAVPDGEERPKTLIDAVAAHYQT